MIGLDRKAFLLAIAAVCFIGITTSSPISSRDFTSGPLNIPGLQFLGSTGEKELYIPMQRTSSFQYALGFGCPIVFGAQTESNLTLATIETPEEVAILDGYFAAKQSENPTAYPELVWTSGIDRLGNVKMWASTGKAITEYPTGFQGDWSPGQGLSPIVANYNCVAIWRYCDRQGHGPTIPKCSSVPYGTWFTPRPCLEARRYICERRV